MERLNLKVGDSKPYLWNGSTAIYCENSASGGAYVPPVWNIDYTTQLELRDIEKYVKVLGYPTIIYKGQRYDMRALADVIGVKYTTLYHHAGHGAIGYKDMKWDYDYHEYHAKIAAFEAERQARDLAKEEAKEQRRKDIREKLEFFKQVRAAKRRERNQGILSEVVMTPRETKPGLIRWYLDGVQTTKDKAPQIMDMSLNMMENLARKGNFTFRGHTLEVRYYVPPVKRAKAGRPKGQPTVKCRVTLIDGEPMSMGNIGLQIGMTKAQVKYNLNKNGGKFEKDGRKIEFAEGNPLSYRTPRKCIDKM